MSDRQTMQSPPGTVSDAELAGRMPLDTSSGMGAVTKTPVEASQGVKLGVMRYVLGISLVLVIVAMVVAYLVARS